MKALHLVGSIPLDTPKDVFETFGRTLASHLACCPDGEVGLRRHWISRVHFQVFAIHPDIETIQRPALENGVERLMPRSAADSWRFRVGAYCGFGRLPSEDLPRVLEEHERAAALLGG